MRLKAVLVAQSPRRFAGHQVEEDSAALCQIGARIPLGQPRMLKLRQVKEAITQLLACISNVFGHVVFIERQAEIEEHWVKEIALSEG